MRKFVPNPSLFPADLPAADLPAPRPVEPTLRRRGVPTLLLFVVGLLAGAVVHREVSRRYPIPAEAVVWDSEAHGFVWK